MLSRVLLNSQLTQEIFAGFMGESVEPKGALLAFTVYQRGNVVNACAALGVKVIKCNYHRVNSAVLWSCLLYTSPSPRDKRQSRMPSSA